MLNVKKSKSAGMKSLEEKCIPASFDFSTVPSLRLEARRSLPRSGPRPLARPARISGVSPADISILLVWLKRAGAAGLKVEEIAVVNSRTGDGTAANQSKSWSLSEVFLGGGERIRRPAPFTLRDRARGAVDEPKAFGGRRVRSPDDLPRLQIKNAIKQHCKDDGAQQLASGAAAMAVNCLKTTDAIPPASKTFARGNCAPARHAGQVRRRQMVRLAPARRRRPAPLDPVGCPPFCGSRTSIRFP